MPPKITRKMKEKDFVLMSHNYKVPKIDKDYRCCIYS